MDRKRSFAHIINPVAAGPASDLNIAQPITFESMRVARDVAGATCPETCDVQLFTTQYPEDHRVLPPGFQVTPDLDRSILDLGQFKVPRKLPIMGDIIQRLHAASAAEYFIYTNVDIALMPNFYTAVAAIIDSGIDACVINRRTIPARYRRVDELPLMYAEAGAPHPGYDCFVFRRDIVPRFDMGTVCIGAPRVGVVFAANLICYARQFREFSAVHLTFHLGDDGPWQDPRLQDYTDHNTVQRANVFQRLAPQFDRTNLPDVTNPFLKNFLGRLAQG